ncbi:MAG: hypothetical protein U0800_15770 [Isosphaeraceae bacterium]
MKRYERSAASSTCPTPPDELPRRVVGQAVEQQAHVLDALRQESPKAAG